MTSTRLPRDGSRDHHPRSSLPLLTSPRSGARHCHRLPASQSCSAWRSQVRASAMGYGDHGYAGAKAPPSLEVGMHVNAGDTAWMLTSTALVFFMMPGLALFYGGLVGAKNVI